MIKQLNIERFKSIKKMELSCRRINLLIGEPNVGKSNILEALGVLSWCSSRGKALKEFVRHQLSQQLFYDSLMDDPVQIECQGEPACAVSIRYERGHFLFSSSVTPQTTFASLDFNGNQESKAPFNATSAFRFYRFHTLEKYESGDPGVLLPPDGRNLFSVVFGSKTLREWLVELYRPYGLSVVMKPHENVFELQKQQDGVVTAYPYFMSSDTLQRMLFYHAAMTSNKDAILIFEEPEAHAFPYYTKHLGESIALSETNQYFIATHNPYLLSAIVEKANKTEVAVFATYYRDFETKTRMLKGEELGRLMEADPFLSLEQILANEESA